MIKTHFLQGIHPDTKLKLMVRFFCQYLDKNERYRKQILDTSIFYILLHIFPHRDAQTFLRTTNLPCLNFYDVTVANDSLSIQE